MIKRSLMRTCGWLCAAINLLSLVGCATTPPRQANDLCAIFQEKKDWYPKAAKAAQRWQTPLPSIMAIMYQESGFRANAKPPRSKILWVIPGPRLSDAYGYPQAKDDTWDWYQQSTGHSRADRRDFEDAADFIAWYNQQSVERAKIARTDVFAQYLAYHEGHGGYNRKSYVQKNWLLNTAKTVQQRAQRYQSQLLTCEEALRRRRSGWWF